MGKTNIFHAKPHPKIVMVYYLSNIFVLLFVKSLPTEY